jgi:hypothetical protein
MRIESSGIYNSRGLTNDNNLPGSSNKITRKDASEERLQVPKTAQLQGNDKPAVAKSLTPEESVEIFRLFGKFDAGSLNRLSGKPESNSPIGRYVDIIV